MKLTNIAKINNDRLFNFHPLIAKYSKGIVEVIEKSQGQYDMNNGGEWVDSAVTRTTITPAAIVPLSSDDLKAMQGGTMSEDSRKLYCYVALKKGTEVVNTMNNGGVSYYTVLQESDYSDFDERLRIYILKRIDRNDTDN